MQDNQNKTTNFGFKQIPTDEKVEAVANIFHSIAKKYDIMNDLMSCGIHRLWKRHTISQSGVHAGSKVLDVAGGTGDLTLQFSRLVGSKGQVILADINDSMLKIGCDKIADHGAVSNVKFVQANAEKLPFPDDTFDCITIAFGLRNVTDKSKALASMYRVLKPGGRLLVLEFSKPESDILSELYNQYSFRLLPLMGKVITNDADSYRYLAESIHIHPDQETLKKMMNRVGFERTSYQNLTLGIVALHKGFKF